MGAFLLARLVGMIGVVVGVLVSVFLLPRLVPTDPCLAMLGEKATDAQLAACHAHHHLDQPLPAQFFAYAHNLLRGDLGISIRTHQAVLTELEERLPATLELSLAALVVTLLLGVPLGVLAASHHRTWLEWLIRGLTTVGGTMPVFLLALLLKEGFSSPASGIPRTGRISGVFALHPQITGVYTLDSLLTGNLAALLSSLSHLALPALTLGIYSAAVLARVLHVALLEELAQPYILAVRAKGLRDRWVVLRHALKNALVPTLTMVGLTMGNLLSGTVLTEYVFSWPGIGRYAAEAARTNDFPALIGVTLVAALVYPASHLLIEWGQGHLDPRIVEG
jgi:peptide/nickel transport system permease protein